MIIKGVLQDVMEEMREENFKEERPAIYLVQRNDARFVLHCLIVSTIARAKKCQIWRVPAETSCANSRWQAKRKLKLHAQKSVFMKLTD
jgi:hypothetical protein